MSVKIPNRHDSSHRNKGETMIATAVETAEEAAVPVTAASKLFPNRPATGTIWRWVLEGLKLPGQEKRLKLRAVRIGGRRFIRPKDAETFLAKLNAEPEPTESEARESQQSRAANAGRALDAIVGRNRSNSSDKRPAAKRAAK